MSNRRFILMTAAPLSAAALCLFAIPAAAQQMETAPTQLDYFNAADTSGDASLDGSEYQIYVDTMADGGDSEAMAMRDMDGYEDGFAAADVNADGYISFDELTPDAVVSESMDIDVTVNPIPDIIIAEPTEPDMTEPEMMEPEMEPEMATMDDEMDTASAIEETEDGMEQPEN